MLQFFLEDTELTGETLARMQINRCRADKPWPSPVGKGPREAEDRGGGGTATAGGDEAPAAGGGRDWGLGERGRGGVERRDGSCGRGEEGGWAFQYDAPADCC